MTEERVEYAAGWPPSGQQFFNQAVHRLGLSHADVPGILGVDWLREFDGTPEAAVAALTDYARQHAQDIRDDLRPTPPQHNEALAVAWTNAFLPDGTQVNITARQGTAQDDIVATVLALHDALDTLKLLKNL